MLLMLPWCSFHMLKKNQKNQPLPTKALVVNGIALGRMIKVHWLDVCVHVCVCLCFVVLNTEQCLVVENSHQITVHSTCYIINTKTGKCRFLFSYKSIPLSQTLCDNSALCNIHKMYFNDSAEESKTHLSSKHLMVKFIFSCKCKGQKG